MTYVSEQFRLGMDGGTFLAEASQLGLPPGRFPEQFDMMYQGHRITFRKIARDKGPSGELTGIVYREWGAKLHRGRLYFATILND